MQGNKQLYESTFIVNATLEDGQIESVIGHVAEVIIRNGGEISATNKWGRKRLAYPIQKKNNGFYVNLEYVAPGTVVPQLERVFTLDENILRFLTIQVDKRAVKGRQVADAKKLAQAPPAAPPPPPAAQPPVQTAEREPLFDDDAAARPRDSK